MAKGKKSYILLCPDIIPYDKHWEKYKAVPNHLAGNVGVPSKTEGAMPLSFFNCICEKESMRAHKQGRVAVVSGQQREREKQAPH